MSASAPAEPPAAPSRARALRELAALFLWLGLTGFGGPAAHIALMEEATVRRRRWFSRQELLDMIAACQLIPGPTSTELAMHIGQRRAGLAGLLVAGGAFIFPAAAVTLALAWCYVRYGRLPAAEAVLAGVKPVMIAVVAEALFSLGGAALRSLALVLIAVLALAAAAAGLNEILVLIGSGLLVLLSRLRGRTPPAAAAALPALPALPAAPEAVLTGVATAVAAATPTALFTVFLKIGSLLFGSGYVLLAFLRAELVVRLGWLDERQLLDAVSIGQLTPGPLFTTATFIGYLLGGHVRGRRGHAGHLPARIRAGGAGRAVAAAAATLAPGRRLPGRRERRRPGADDPGGLPAGAGGGGRLVHRRPGAGRRAGAAAGPALPLADPRRGARRLDPVSAVSAAD